MRTGIQNPVQMTASITTATNTNTQPVIIAGDVLVVVPQVLESSDPEFAMALRHRASHRKRFVRPLIVGDAFPVDLTCNKPKRCLSFNFH
jgi:hypothetical protein